MGSLNSEAVLPWLKTPCIPNAQMSKAAGCNIWLKLDNLQPSGSFKSRGIGTLMTRAAAAAAGPGPVHFYCSSGGNAGLAAATAGIALNMPVTVVLTGIASPVIKQKLLDMNVTVHQHGSSWVEADTFMREELMAQDPIGVYVPPFDHPDIWEGASSLVREIQEQVNGPIDGIVCSVGGGGLLNGIMHGVETLPWAGTRPRVLAVETIGADSLNASVRAGEHITLPGITSIAWSLGACQVSKRTWEWSKSPNLKSIVVSDADAAISCVRFADDARQLVEVACGATLSTAYRGDLREHFGQGLSDEEWARKNIVLEVCGGVGITLGILEQYKQTYSEQSSIKV